MHASALERAGLLSWICGCARRGPPLVARGGLFPGSHHALRLCGVNVREPVRPQPAPESRVIHPFLIASSLRCQEQDGTVTRKAHPNSHLNVGDRCAIFVTKSDPTAENNTRYAISGIHSLLVYCSDMCSEQNHAGAPSSAAGRDLRCDRGLAAPHAIGIAK